MKLSGRTFTMLFAVAGLGALVVTDQVLPPSSPYQAQMRVWLAARATGIVSLLLLAAMVVLGLLLSHPEQARWKQAKRIYPWHETLWVFVVAFLVVHVASLLLDPFAQVSPLGAFVPGFSKYRTVPVAVGSMALYATLITGATARWTRLLPSGIWLKLHRFSVVALALGWAHGVLSGSDSGAMEPLYGGIAILVIVSAAYRYWVVRRRGEHARAARTDRPPATPLPAPARVAAQPQPVATLTPALHTLEVPDARNDSAA